MFAVDARVSATPALDYAALVTASIGSYWIARELGAVQVANAHDVARRKLSFAARDTGRQQAFPILAQQMTRP